MYSKLIPTPRQRARGADYKATLVIWGSYDEQGILPHFELLRLPDSLPRHFVQPDALSAPDFHLQGGDREVTFVTLLALGLTRYAERDYSTALSLYDSGLQQLSSDTSAPVPNAESAYYLKALTEYVGGESWTSIANDLKKALALKPKWGDAHYLLGLTYLFACKPDGSMSNDWALNESNSAVQLQADADTYWLRGTVLAQMRHFADAAKSFEQSLKLKDDPSVRASLVDAYQRIGRDDLAAPLLPRPGVTPTPPPAGDLHALTAYADGLSAQRSYPAAELAYQQAISLAANLKRPNVTLASLYGGLASTQSDAGDYGAAVANYLKVESLWGKNWSGYESLGYAYRQLNRNNDAIAAYQQVLGNTLCDESAHLSLAEMYEHQDQANVALDEYRKAALADPENGVTHVSIATILNEQGDSAGADTELRKAVPLLDEQLRQEPVSGNFAYILGAANYQLGNYVAALTAYQKYAQLAPTDPDAPYWVAVMLSALGRYAEAIPFLERANQAKPNVALTLLDLADAYAKASRPSEAIAAYQKVASLDPRNTIAWQSLGRLCAQQQNLAEAAKAYETLLALTPGDAQSHTSLAFIYAALNRPADALKEARAAVALQPKNAGFQTNLALALVNANQNDEAITVAQGALQLDAN